VDDTTAASGRHPVYNLLRLRRDLGQASHLGLAYTDRVEGNWYNRVLGVDTRLIWRTIWFSGAQVAGSWTRDASGVERFGELWNLTFYDRTGRHYGNHLALTGISPDFRAGAGFVNRTGIAQGRIFNRFSTYGRPGAMFEQVTTFIGIEPLWRYRELFKSTLEGTVSQTVLFTLRGGWGANVAWRNAHLRFEPGGYASYREDSLGTVPFAVPHGLYNLWGVSAGVNTPSRVLSASLAIGYQAEPLFDEASRGRAFGLNVGVSWRPTDALRTEASWVHRRFVRSNDGNRFSLANIPRVKVEYQLSRAIMLRYVGEYQAQERAELRSPSTGAPVFLPDGSGGYQRAGAFSGNRLRSDVLFSFRPTPGTVLFLGYGASLTEDESFRFNSLRRTADGLFIKASYLFRL
jgi:hypothetical protein